jgi:hypothetical protein
MPYTVRCKACSSAFAIPDEIWDKRVRGHMATLKCRSCKAEIRVDGTKEGVVQPSLMPPATAGTAPSSPPETSAATEAEMRVVRAPDPAVALPAARGKATTTSPGLAAPAAPGTKPAGKAPQDNSAAESGWSLVPPTAELAKLGLTPKSAPTTERGAAQSPAQKNAPAPPRIAQPAPEPAAPRARQGARLDTAASSKTAPIAAASPAPPVAADLEAPSPADPDLWVVSYGEDDDRELTELQIAEELERGNITLSTIVWQEGMPEWLPISGVRLLSKYARKQKPAPVRQTRLGLGVKTGPQPARDASSPASAPTAPTPAALAARAPAAPAPAAQTPRTPAATAAVPAPAQSATSTPRQWPQTRGKLPSSPQFADKPPQQARAPEPPSAPRGTAGAKARGVDATASEHKRPDGPPPLSRTAEKSVDRTPTVPKAEGPTPTDRRTAPEPGTTASNPDAAPPIARKPPVPNRGEPPSSATSPWNQLAEAVDDDDEVDDVLTSAPHSTDLKPYEETRNPEQTAQPSAAQNTAQSAGQSPQATTRYSPSAETLRPQHPIVVASARPPKPVETATSLVIRTVALPGKDVLITDADFLAMQRRFPKWALPVSILGAVVVTGLIIRAALNKEELPPLPVVTAATPNDDTTYRVDPNGPPLRRHAQPNLDAPLPTTVAAASIEEKDFARLFAESATKTNSTFDTKAAEVAMQNVMDHAARCRVPPDPAGQARVVLTFSTAGQVVSVQVGSPYANTPTGKCIERVMHNVKARPFQGEPARLPVTIPLRQ